MYPYVKYHSCVLKGLPEDGENVNRCIHFIESFDGDFRLLNTSDSKDPPNEAFTHCKAHRHMQTNPPPKTPDSYRTE